MNPSPYEAHAADLRRDLLRRSEDLSVRHLAQPVLDLPPFLKCSGSSKPESHHYGTGGLIYHVHEVVLLCGQNNNALGQPVCASDLFLAALYHDVGKCWDYALYNKEVHTHDRANNQIFVNVVPVWGPTPHRDLIHHINRSAAFWLEHSNGYEGRDKVWHAILAHHSRPKWGSPRKPQTKLAWLLHLCDAISARLDDADRKKGEA